MRGRSQVFFWAPMMKWALVVAGFKDLQRPADKLSFSQNLALAVTGMIWVRCVGRTNELLLRDYAGKLPTCGGQLFCRHQRTCAARPHRPVSASLTSYRYTHPDAVKSA